MIDSHSHIYSEEFDTDREEIIKRSIESGVTRSVLANVDQDSFEQIVQCWTANNEYFIHTIGGHPTEVNDKSLKSLLDFRDNNRDSITVKALGVTGLALYYDITFIPYHNT